MCLLHCSYVDNYICMHHILLLHYFSLIEIQIFQKSMNIKYKILHSSDHNRSPILIYSYPEQTNTNVITNGLTFANNIPLFNITTTDINVQIVVVVNETDNPPSDIFTTQECSKQTNINCNTYSW